MQFFYSPQKKVRDAIMFNGLFFFLMALKISVHKTIKPSVQQRDEPFLLGGLRAPGEV